MSPPPKFRGDSDDWLDDQASSRRVKGKKAAPSARSRSLPPEEANGVVAEVFPNQCSVRLDGAVEELLCKYRRTAVFDSTTETRERAPVAVGDRVKVEPSGDAGVIAGVCERKNSLSRPAPGKDGRQVVHVLASNIDQLVIVASAQRPEFSPGLVDRFLVAAAAAGIEPVVCVTKMDLENDPSLWRVYADIGLRVFAVSARRGDGIAGLREALLGKAVVFCGHSGVGKTSLLSALIGADAGRVGEVSDATGKGRHTTTGAFLLQGPQGSRWIDTPGIREFGLIGVTPGNLSDYFPEMAAIDCAAPGCRHCGEAGCEAARLFRYPSYLRIYQSLLEREG